MAVDPAILGVAMTAVGTAANAFNSYLPRLSEVRRSHITDPGMVGDVRMGEVAAITVTIGVGVLASALTDSPMPAFTAAIMAVILVLIYETALKGENLFEPNRPAPATADLTTYPEGY